MRILIMLSSGKQPIVLPKQRLERHINSGFGKRETLIMSKNEQVFTGAFNVVFQNWSTLFCFEMIYRGTAATLLFPLHRYLLALLPGLAGEAYLGQENIASVFHHPAALLLLIAIALMTGLYIFFEITALFICAEKGWRREQISVWELWHETVVKSVGLIRLNRLPVFLMLPFMALSVFAVLSGYLRMVKIPEFVMDYIKTAPLLLIFFTAVVVFCHIILFLYIFGVPHLLFTQKSFAASWKESLKMLHGKKLRTAGILYGYILLFILARAAALGAGIFLIYGGVRLSYPNLKTAEYQFQLHFRSFQEVESIAAGALISAFLCAGIVVLYHQYRKNRRPDKKPQPMTLCRTTLRVCAALGTLSLLIIFSESELGGRIIFPEIVTTRVVAHRGSAVVAPENTIASLLQAVKDGAEMAEIDVRQLKDGTLILMHDANFKRTTGVDLNVWDADIEMVQRLDAGSFFSPDFAGEPVATLENVLSEANGRIDLMIELKPTGREQNLVRETLSLIQKHDMEDQCVIASMDAGLLNQVKSSAPGIQTVLISVLLLTEEYNLKDVDAFSVETTSLSPSMVVQAHLLGKQVYAWTANSKENINKILNCGADGVITDNPLLARSCIEQIGRNFFMEELTELLFP